MYSVDLYAQEMETQRRMAEAQQRAANARLARQARAGKPSFATRVRLVFGRVTMPLSGRSGQRRAPGRRTAASPANLTQGDILLL